MEMEMEVMGNRYIGNRKPMGYGRKRKEREDRTIWNKDETLRGNTYNSRGLKGICNPSGLEMDVFTVVRRGIRLDGILVEVGGDTQMPREAGEVKVEALHVETCKPGQDNAREGE